jgi:hypothetical protein
MRRVYDGSMQTKPVEGKPALEEFTRAMKALFRVPKSAVEESRKPFKPKRVQKAHS